MKIQINKKLSLENRNHSSVFTAAKCAAGAKKPAVCVIIPGKPLPDSKARLLSPKPRKEGRKVTERELMIYPLTPVWPAFSHSLLSAEMTFLVF